MTRFPRFSLRTLALFPPLLTCAIGLLLRWPAWTLEARTQLQPFVVSAGFSANGQDVIIRRWEFDAGSNVSGGEETVWSIDGSKEVQSRTLPAASAPMDKGLPDISPDGTRTLEIPIGPSRGYDPYVLAHNDGSKGQAVIVDARSRHWLVCLLAEESDVVSARFSPDGEKIVTATTVGDIRVFRRRRPEWLWGLAWLPEFWLTAAFAGLFVWSVVRDRRRLGARSEPTE